MNASAHIARKFTFDREFLADTDVVPNAVRARMRKNLTQDEIDAMCEKAHEEGKRDGSVAAADRTAAGVAALEKAVREALAASAAGIAAVREDAVQVAFAAAKKLARVAVAAFPEGEVEAALREAVRQAASEPRITLRAAPAVVAALEDRLAAISAEEGYDGRISAVADPAAKGSDCRIEWRGGGAERNLAAIEAGIESAIERRFVKAPAAAGTKG
jgi:flagellar assembly protein FliH